MNGEELLLELDRAERRFRPGDAITGRVRVGPTTSSVGRPLVVAMWWQTTGEGDVDRGAEHLVELAASDAAIAGRTFSFSCSAAPGPLSYRGRKFSVEWRVEARLGSPGWRSRVPTWQGIVLDVDQDAPVRGIAVAQLLWLAGKAPISGDVGTAVLSREVVSRLLEDVDRFDRKAEPARIGCAVLSVVGIVAFPAFLMADFLVGGELVGRHIGKLYLGVASLLLAAVLVALARSRRNERDLGLTLCLADRIVQPGEDLVCTLGVHPVRPIGISGAEIRVTGEESSTTTDPGEAGSTRTVELFRATVMASPPRTFLADVSEQLIVRVPLPRDAAATFESPNHGVEWRALVTLKPVHGAPIARKLTFVVYPPPRDAPDSQEL